MLTITVYEFPLLTSHHLHDFLLLVVGKKH